MRFGENIVRKTVLSPIPVESQAALNSSELKSLATEINPRPTQSQNRTGSTIFIKLSQQENQLRPSKFKIVIPTENLSKRSGLIHGENSAIQLDQEFEKLLTGAALMTIQPKTPLTVGPKQTATKPTKNFAAVQIPQSAIEQETSWEKAASLNQEQINKLNQGLQVGKPTQIHFARYVSDVYHDSLDSARFKCSSSQDPRPCNQNAQIEHHESRDRSEKPASAPESARSRGKISDHSKLNFSPIVENPPIEEKKAIDFEDLQKTLAILFPNTDKVPILSAKIHEPVIVSHALQNPAPDSYVIAAKTIEISHLKTDVEESQPISQSQREQINAIVHSVVSAVEAVSKSPTQRVPACKSRSIEDTAQQAPMASGSFLTSRANQVEGFPMKHSKPLTQQQEATGMMSDYKPKILTPHSSMIQTVDLPMRQLTTRMTDYQYSQTDDTLIKWPSRDLLKIKYFRKLDEPMKDGISLAELEELHKLEEQRNSESNSISKSAQRQEPVNEVVWVFPRELRFEKKEARYPSFTRQAGYWAQRFASRPAVKYNRDYEIPDSPVICEKHKARQQQLKPHRIVSVSIEGLSDQSHEKFKKKKEILPLAIKDMLVRQPAVSALKGSVSKAVREKLLQNNPARKINSADVSKCRDYQCLQAGSPLAVVFEFLQLLGLQIQPEVLEVVRERLTKVPEFVFESNAADNGPSERMKILDRMRWVKSQLETNATIIGWLVEQYNKPVIRSSTYIPTAEELSMPAAKLVSKPSSSATPLSSLDFSTGTNPLLGIIEKGGSLLVPLKNGPPGSTIEVPSGALLNTQNGLNCYLGIERSVRHVPGMKNILSTPSGEEFPEFKLEQYRVKPCKSFHGHHSECKYGHRCVFAHDGRFKGQKVPRDTVLQVRLEDYGPEPPKGYRRHYRDFEQNILGLFRESGRRADGGDGRGVGGTTIPGEDGYWVKWWEVRPPNLRGRPHPKPHSSGDSGVQLSANTTAAQNNSWTKQHSDGLSSNSLAI